MATPPHPPQPPYAPAPPQAPRSSSNVVAIAVLVLALIVLVSGIAVWIGVKYISNNVRMHVQDREGGKKEFSINTPVGSLEVHNRVDGSSLDLPVYPGAIQKNDKDSANVSLAFGGEQNVRVLAVKYETTDPLENVKAFYKERLGSEVTKVSESGFNGKTTFEMSAKNQKKIVAIESSGGKTRISLVRVTFGKDESN